MAKKIVFEIIADSDCTTQMCIRDSPRGLGRHWRWQENWTSYHINHWIKCGKVKDIVLSSCQITIRKTAEEVGISYKSYEAICTDVSGMKRVAARFVSKLLNFQQKQHPWTNVGCSHWWPDLFKHIIQGDKTWEYSCGNEIKAYLSQWKLLEQPRQ